MMANSTKIPVTLAYVAGPQTSNDVLYNYDIAKRTMDLAAYSDFETFKIRLQWTYYALLHSLASENCKIALIPWISKVSTHKMKYREKVVREIVEAT